MNASATNDCASHLVAVSTHEVLKLHVLGIKKHCYATYITCGCIHCVRATIF